MKAHIKLEDITAYKIASELSDLVYDSVSKWPWFDKKSLGSQYVEATDSIAANIAEGFGLIIKGIKHAFIIVK